LFKNSYNNSKHILAPRHSIVATRILAREGINVEQLTRDLKSFELKPTFNDKQKYQHYCYFINKMKRHIGSFALLQRDTLVQCHTPFGRLYKQRNMVKKSVSLEANSKIKIEAESKEEIEN
jgi:hypothetical protein